MIIGACKINSAADFRGDFDFRVLYAQYMENKKVFARMIAGLKNDVLAIDEKGKRDEKWNVCIDGIGFYAGEGKETYTLRKDLESMSKCPLDALKEEKMMTRIAADKKWAPELKTPVSEQAARNLWIFVMLHQMANCEAKAEDLDWMMSGLEKKADQKWMDKTEYVLGSTDTVQLPYFSGEEGGMDAWLEIVALTYPGLTPVTVTLEGTNLSRKLYRNQTLYALRKGILGYTGFLCCVKNKNDAVKRTFGCVSFEAGGLKGKKPAISYGKLERKACSHYRMPCLAADGSTVFIGNDNSLYRMKRNGDCEPIPNLQNVVVAEACVLANGEYIMLDAAGAVFSSKSGRIATKGKGVSLAMHGDACCVLLEDGDGADGGAELLTIGMDKEKEMHLLQWAAQKKISHSITSLQTKNVNGAACLECCISGGEIIAYK